MIPSIHSRMELFPIQRHPCDNHNLGVGFQNISFFLSKIALEVFYYPPEFIFNTTCKEYLLITERYIKVGLVSIGMIKQECSKCGKVIEGYSKKHVDFLMAQHSWTHRKKENKEAQNETTRL